MQLINVVALLAFCSGVFAAPVDNGLAAYEAPPNSQPAKDHSTWKNLDNNKKKDGSYMNYDKKKENEYKYQAHQDDKSKQYQKEKDAMYKAKKEDQNYKYDTNKYKNDKNKEYKYEKSHPDYKGHY
ncbi:hypothetical protein BT63DRAFT_460036 [Microthyrium microscopicum]|uniref:Uncharacterized protein n=1 Tax=Microthyrium microscopicum TaxID=703497 RepID=A0A6A6TWR8_9PEZI|nr:hypothetical protein BT63DRAFT_460036 [Microthyrium microscopicum]